MAAEQDSVLTKQCPPLVVPNNLISTYSPLYDTKQWFQNIKWACLWVFGLSLVLTLCCIVLEHNNLSNTTSQGSGHNVSGEVHLDHLSNSWHKGEFPANDYAPMENVNVDSWPVNDTTGQGQNNRPHKRIKRGVIELASMIHCVTGCNPFMYKDYGCYCGFLGDGYPVDGIDRCCLMHDNCYSRADCHQALVYFKSYKWACLGYGRAKCAQVSSSLCALQLCECDRKFAKCLSRYRCPHSKAGCDTESNFVIGK